MASRRGPDKSPETSSDATSETSSAKPADQGTAKDTAKPEAAAKAATDSKTAEKKPEATPGAKSEPKSDAKPLAKALDKAVEDSAAQPADKAAIKSDAKSGPSAAKAELSAEADNGAGVSEPATLSEPSAPDAGDFDPYRDDDLHDGDPRDGDLPHAAYEEEHGQRSFAATALMALIGILVIASLTLWAAPKLAPHLPAGIAKYLMPGEMQAAGRLAALEEALAKQRETAEAAVSALKAEVAALAGRVDAGTGSEVAETAKAAAESAAADAAALAGHLATVDQDLAALRGEVSAMSTALSEAASGSGVSPAELSAGLSALGARLDKLAAAVEEGAAAQALEQKLTALGERMAAVETSAADAETKQQAALGEVETQLQATRLQAALDIVASRLTNGLPFGTKLNEAAGMAGKAPPEALSGSADTGVATATELEGNYSRYANAAVAADVRARSGDGALGAFGWLKSQVAGRPVDEQEGEGVGAVTSRIGARVAEGDLTGALAEAEALPEHAQAGLGRWLERLRARVTAESALEDWRTEIGVGG